MATWVGVVIAFGVALISYAQWRTANQRVVLDLFQKRIDVYEDIESALGVVLREGKVDEDAFRRFLTSKLAARFLFGRDVLAYLDSIYKDIVSLNTIYRDDVIDTKPDREALINKKYDAFNHIAEFAQNAPEIFAPYMRMNQKNTPFWRPW
jgi:hypothetical protein